MFAGAERNIDCRRVGVAVEGPASQLTRVASSQLIPTHRRTQSVVSRRGATTVALLPSAPLFAFAPPFSPFLSPLRWLVPFERAVHPLPHSVSQFSLLRGPSQSLCRLARDLTNYADPLASPAARVPRADRQTLPARSSARYVLSKSPCAPSLYSYPPR